MFWVSELSYCIVSHAHYLVFLVANVNESSPIGVPSTSYSKDIQNTAESDLKSAPHLFRLLWWEYPGSYNPFLREVCNESSILGEYLSWSVAFRERASNRQSYSPCDEREPSLIQLEEPESTILSGLHIVRTAYTPRITTSYHNRNYRWDIK